MYIYIYILKHIEIKKECLGYWFPKGIEPYYTLPA